MQKISKFNPLFAAFLVLALTACGDNETNIYAQDVAEPGHEDHDHEEDEHDHDHEEDEHDHEEDEHDHEDELSAARLLLIEAGTDTVHVFEASDGDEVAELTLPAAVSYVYPMQGYRYAAFIHRDDNWVSFVDGGVWVEDHGDHDHPYAEAPQLMDFALDGVKPTHFTLGDAGAAVFYDGNGDTADVAGVVTFSDATIAENGLENALQFTTHMHGAAQLRGEHVLATERDAATSSTLPAAVGLYHLHGGLYEHELTFAEPCPGLHGSAQSEDAIFFGCEDGVLLIDEPSDFSATKITNADDFTDGMRVGTLRAHHHVAQAVAIASGKFYLADPSQAQLQPLGVSMPEGVSAVSYEFVLGGEAFAILQSDGALVLLDAHDWSEQARIQVLTSPAADALTLIVQPEGHMAYVLNSADQQVIPVDLEDAVSADAWSLDFAPAGGVWLGVATEEHDH
ncbi:hypothetical protein [Gilvimarinus polysaccharolyticus]|uniref:hypothetical protein n=1 Tax=Gilvimarinus polysaccharolyticus TaxID=863921 RepID=UPI0006735B51|nr:hypothetical protein [Gilvimarinus polysaccharolyticus]